MPAIDHKHYLIKGDQRGSVIVIAMIMLCLLTIVGVAAVNTSRFETLISKTETETQQAFYAADGGIQYALQQIAQSVSPSGTSSLDETNVTITETKTTETSASQRAGSSISFGDKVLKRYRKIYTITSQATTTGTKTLEAQATADVWEPR